MQEQECRHHQQGDLQREEDFSPAGYLGPIDGNRRVFNSQTRALRFTVYALLQQSKSHSGSEKPIKTTAFSYNETAVAMF